MRNDVLNQILENIGGEKLPTDSNDRNRILSAINVQLGGEPFPLDAQRNDILRAINNSFGGETQPEFTARREFLLAIEAATHVDGVTFESYSEDSILAAIEFNTREGGLASWTPDYKGAGYITIEPWRGKAGDTIEMTVTPTVSNFAILDGYSGESGTLKGADIYIHVNKKLMWNAAIVGTTLNINGTDYTRGSYTMTEGTPHVIKATIVATNRIFAIGVNRNSSAPFSGSITDIKLTTLDGSDNRHYPSTIKSKEQPTTLFLENTLGKFGLDEWSVDYQGEGYVQLRKPWYGKVGDSVTFKARYELRDGWSRFLTGYGVNAWVAVNRPTGDTPVWTRSAEFNIYVDGKQVVGSAAVPVGVDMDIEVRLVKDVPIHLISHLVNPFNGYITNIHFNSATDPRHYPSIIKSPTQPTITTLENILDPSGETNGELIGFGYEELPPPSSSRMGYYNSSTLTYSKDKPQHQQITKDVTCRTMTLYREKKVYDGWTNKMGKHGQLNGFAVGEGWKEV